MRALVTVLNRGPIRTLTRRFLLSSNTFRELQRRVESSEAALARLLQSPDGSSIPVLPGAGEIGAALRAEIAALRTFAGLAPAPERHDTPISCRMADGLYIQADGSMPCYCSAGITRRLGKIDGGDVMEFYRGKVMTALRTHLAEGVFPWPECGPCRVKTLHAERPVEVAPREIPIIHLEPTSVCNLRCPGCHATEVMEGRAPRRRTFFPFEKFKELIDSIDIPVRQIAFCGYGEPLLNVDVPRMIAYAKSRLAPAPLCSIDTNANIERLDAGVLIASGVDLIRFALDGAFQRNYEQYRRRGNLDLAVSFMRQVAAERDRQQTSTMLVWKYVIFSHNDTIEELEHAIALCAEIGVGFDYSRAAGILAGTSDRDTLVVRIRKLLERHGVDDVVDGERRSGPRRTMGEEDAWKYATP
jgi:pyruvate-formate lyase-activating enzyme